MIAVELKDVHKKFGEKIVLNAVDLTIPSQCIFGLLGPNGAGKTTLLRILTQIIPPDKGSISLFNHPLNHSILKSVGYLPEERGLYKKMNLLDQLTFFGKLKGIKSKDLSDRINYWLTKFRLGDHKKSVLSSLSKGNQQKVQFIASILHHPELLILDEPFSGLDPLTADSLTAAILEYRDHGNTIIFSSHRMDTIEDLCEYISLLKDGKIVLQGTLTNILQKYSDNRFKVTGYGNLLPADGQWDILSHKEDGSFSEYILKISTDAVVPEILNKLISKMKVHSFQQVIPGLKEIYLSFFSGQDDSQ